MYFWIVFSALLIWCLTRWFQWWKKIFRYMEKLPGPTWCPLLGTTHMFAGCTKSDVFEVGLKSVAKYKPLFRTWTGHIPELNIMKPEHLETVMKSSTHLSKGVHYNLLLPWLGEGLLLSKGSKWHLHRKLITPAFHFKILENFFEVFAEKSKLLVKNLETRTEGKYFDIYPLITHCTLDMICETAMGVSVNAMSNTQGDYVRSIYEVSEIMMWRTFVPFLWWDPIFYLCRQGKRFKKAVNILHTFSNKLIADRKKLFLERKQNQVRSEDDVVYGRKKRLSFIDILLEASQDERLLTDTDIREEVDTFIFEGHDTTTAAICWSLFLLGNYPKVQDRIYDEIQTVLQGKLAPTSLTELSELKYLEYAIKEALRLYPSVPYIIRSLTEDLCLDGYTIPTGAQVVMHIYGVHRDPEQFPDPEKFDPDRFLPENAKGRHPYSYVPFSAGPRNCIGQKFAMYEVKTVLASIINNFKIISEKSPEEVKIFVDIVMRPQKGISLKLERRKV